METISKLYAQEYKDPEDEPAKPEEIEGLKAEANEVAAEALTVDDPEQAAIQEALKPLKEEWGSAYESNLTAAQGLVEHFEREMGLDAVEVFDHWRAFPRPKPSRQPVKDRQDCPLGA
jgi:hypothetical protein